MRILDVMWFNGCAIVRVESDFDGIKYYIRSIIGDNAEQDKQLVADYGSSFPKFAGDLLFGIK